MKCAICNTRKARRYCPGIRAEICSVCCGTERENTVSCPFDCEYLREARLRERHPEPENIPNLDIRVPDRYLEEHAPAASLVSEALADAVFDAPGAIDYDVRDALEALVRTHRTLQSGLIYESRPPNPVAAKIYEAVRENIQEARKEHTARTGLSIADSELLGMLLILQRAEYRENNGRQRGRAFIDFLRLHFPRHAAEAAPSALIV